MRILLIIISVLLNSFAQILMRKGMLQNGILEISQIHSNIASLLSNFWLWAAFLLYAVSIVLWMAVLSKTEISFAYPFLSIGYVVVTLAGYYLLNEQISAMRIVGMIVICIGVVLISRS